MKIFTSSCLIAIANVATLTAFACENPSMVPMPDGQTSTREQMLDAQTKVKGYMAAMEEYRACLNDELEAAGEDAPAEFKSLMITRHNAAVTEMESVASAFNDQLRAFRAANPEPAAN
jgi:hypothetical protein